MNQPAEGERGSSPVATPRKPWLSRRTMTIGLGVVVAGVAGMTFWRTANPPPEPVQEKLPRQLAVTVPYVAPTMILPTPVVASQPMPHASPAPQPSSQPSLPMPTREPIARITSKAAITPPPPPPKPNMVSFDDPPTRQEAHGAGGVHGGGPGGSPGGSGISYAASHVAGVRASLMGDQTFLLKPGLLPCILDTAINSTFEGPITCHIPFDIKPRGVTLLGRNSQIHGWYKNNVQTGQSRMFAQADWVEDPATGCFIQFANAPLSDGIGEAGIPGNVDNHYFERFGAAMLLTLGESGMSLAQAAMSKGGNTYLNFNSGGGVESISSAILRKQIDIPPTIVSPQGAAIAVFVTKVMDFSPCYSLQLKGH